MWKRVLCALLLTACLTGCGKEPDFYSIMREVVEAGNGTYTVEGTVLNNTTGENICNIQMNGRFNKEGDATLKLNTEFDVNGFLTTTPFETEIRLIDNTVYIDVACLVTSFGNLAFADAGSYTYVLDLFGDTQWISANTGDNVGLSAPVPDCKAKLAEYRSTYLDKLTALEKTVTASEQEGKYILSADLPTLLPAAADVQLTGDVKVSVQKINSLYSINIYYSDDVYTCSIVIGVKKASSVTSFVPPKGAVPVSEAIHEQDS